MNAQPASIHITKPAAAQRQLDAAITMYIRGEDPLAVHTVAAAAFGILRHLYKRKGDFVADTMSLGIFEAAKAIYDGTISKQEIAIYEKDGTLDILMPFVEIIKQRDGTCSWQDLELPNIKGLYKGLTTVANFLKHADRDLKETISPEDVDNEILLCRACANYLQLYHKLTPEMTVAIALISLEERFNPGALDALKENVKISAVRKLLMETKPSQRRAKCLWAIRRLHEIQKETAVTQAGDLREV